MLSFYLLGAKKIFSFLKKAFLVITVYILIIFLFNVLEQKSNQNRIDFDKIKTFEQSLDYDFLNNKELQNKNETKILVKIYKSYNCFIIGDFCSNKNSRSKNYQNSLLGKINNIFAYLLTVKPASFSYWAKNSLEKSGLIPKIFAENKTYTGIGLQSMRSLYILWENFRNLSFLIITLVLVGIGFMIMFRTKINPQTVISIENALPKIIISMILITFSYPIVGLMIDLMYLSFPIVASLFKNILYMRPTDFFTELNFLKPLQPYNLFSKPVDIFLHVLNIKPTSYDSILDNVFFKFIYLGVFGVIFDIFNLNLYYKFINDIISGGFILPDGIIGDPIKMFIKLIFSSLIFFLITVIYKPIGEWFVNLMGDFGGGTLGIVRIAVFLILSFVALSTIIFLIIILGLLFLALRIFFFLLSCLLNLIIYIILAPLYLLLEAIPGKNSFSSWIKNIIGNLAVFPAFLFIVLLQRSLFIFVINDPSSFLTLPGLSGPLDFSNNQLTLFILSSINLYILLMIPDFLKLVKATIIGKEGLSMPASIGIAFGGVGATLGAVSGIANQFYYLKLGYDNIFGNKKMPKNQNGEIPPKQEYGPKEILSSIIKGKK